MCSQSPNPSSVTDWITFADDVTALSLAFLDFETAAHWVFRHWMLRSHGESWRLSNVLKGSTPPTSTASPPLKNLSIARCPAGFLLLPHTVFLSVHGINTSSKKLCTPVSHLSVPLEPQLKPFKQTGGTWLVTLSPAHAAVLKSQASRR